MTIRTCAEAASYFRVRPLAGWWKFGRKDRRWFQLLTLVGGIAGSAISTYATLAYGSGAFDETVRDILVGIWGSFVSSGFFAWGILQFKELIMPIGDWIREATERKRQQRLAEEERRFQQARSEGLEAGRTEGREAGLEAGRQEGRREGREEGYTLGYRDAQEGKPERPPAPTNGKGTDVDDLRC